MEHQQTLIWEVNFLEFFFVTIVLAGGAAYLTGRALANSWLGTTHIVIYMLLLTGATRFIHFSLFEGTLLSPYYFLVDFIVLLAIAALGFKVTRNKQMARQYRFLAAEGGH